MITPSSGKVPQFSLRPHPVVMTLLLLTLMIGILTALSFFAKEDGSEINHHRGIFTLIVTSVISVCLAVIATSKMWFSHLWKRNSSHARHKRHTHHHPAVRNQDRRTKR